MLMSNKIVSTWEWINRQEISSEQALRNLVDEQGVVNLDLLEEKVSLWFFQQMELLTALPPVIPLLRTRHYCYLGSPAALTQEEILELSDRTNTDIKIIPIAEQSYWAWYFSETFNTNGISSATLVKLKFFTAS